MKMPNITPGPWFTEKPDYADQSIAVSTKTYDPKSGHKTWSGFIQCYGIQDEPQIGSQIMQINAQAVAALPDLLEALIGMVGLVETAINLELVEDVDFFTDYVKLDTVRAMAALLKAGCADA